MSSTNRKNAAERHKSDYYVTPKAAIHTFLQNIMVDGLINNKTKYNILDPCAGGDSLNDMSYPYCIERLFPELNIDFKIKTIDTRPDSLAEIKDSFFNYNSKEHNLIITNPPFNIALDIIKHSLDMCCSHGLVIMLLRLNFFGSKERSSWFKENMPTYTYVHSKRMAFTNDNKTDSIEYAHMVWEKDHHPRFTKLRII